MIKYGPHSPEFSLQDQPFAAGMSFSTSPKLLGGAGPVVGGAGSLDICSNLQVDTPQLYLSSADVEQSKRPFLPAALAVRHKLLFCKADPVLEPQGKHVAGHRD